MSFHPQNKPLAICIAGLTAITLTGIAALLNVFAPAGLLPGLLVRVVSLAVILPLVLLGFNVLCDRCDGQQNPAAHAANHEEQAEQTGLVYRGISLDADNMNGRFSAPLSPAVPHNGRTHKGNSSGQIVVPVSIHQRSLRTVPAGKKWWVGQ